VHSLTENYPDNEFSTQDDTNLNTWHLLSFCAVNREWRNMLVTLVLLEGVLL